MSSLALREYAAEASLEPVTTSEELEECCTTIEERDLSDVKIAHVVSEVSSLARRGGAIETLSIGPAAVDELSTLARREPVTPTEDTSAEELEVCCTNEERSLSATDNIEPVINEVSTFARRDTAANNILYEGEMPTHTTNA